MSRDIARKIGLIPPIVLYMQSLMGFDRSEKMSTSIPASMSVLLTDDGARQGEQDHQDGHRNDRVITGTWCQPVKRRGLLRL
jgi:hypothetical protein